MGEGNAWCGKHTWFGTGREAQPPSALTSWLPGWQVKSPSEEAMPLGLGPGQSIPGLFPPLRGSSNKLGAIGPLHFCKALPGTLTLPTT